MGLRYFDGRLRI